MVLFLDTLEVASSLNSPRTAADFNFNPAFGCVIDPPEETFLLQYLAHKINYESAKWNALYAV